MCLLGLSKKRNFGNDNKKMKSYNKVKIDFLDMSMFEFSDVSLDIPDFVFDIPDVSLELPDMLVFDLKNKKKK